jgi:hypothetical protein
MIIPIGDFTYLLDVLHDSIFTLSEVKFEKDSKLLRIYFEREGTEVNEKILVEKKFGIFRKYKYPIIKSELIISQVKLYNIKYDQGIDSYMLNNIIFSGSKLILNSCEEMELVIEFENGNIQIEFNDLGKIRDHISGWLI